MRILVLFLALMFNASIPSFAQSEDGWITTPFDPAVGETVKYRIRKSDVAQGKMGKTKPTSISDVSIEFLGHQEDGYVYRLTYTKIVPEDPELAKIPEVRQMLGLVEGISLDYIADETGTPVAIRDLAEVQKWLLGPALDLLDQTGTNEQATQGVRSFFMNLTPESAAELLLKDIAPIFSATGLQLPLNEPLELEGTIPWQVTGTDLDIEGSAKIISSNDDVLKVEIRQGYSRESVLAGIQTLATRLVPSMPEDKKREMQAQLKAMESFDIRQSVDATVSMVTGWPSELIAVSDTDMGTARRTITHQVWLLSPDGE